MPESKRPGNRALRALVGMDAQAGTLAGRGHFDLARDWVQGKEADRWDTVVDGRRWQRMEMDGHVYYQYEREDGVVDAHSDDWQPLDQWREAGIDPPGELPAPEETTAPEPAEASKARPDPEPQAISDLPDAEWDLDAFLAALKSNGLDGVCNGLTLAFLAGLLTPTEEQDRGLSHRKFAMVQRLKWFLDSATARWHHKILEEGLDESYRSETVTKAMLAWLSGSSTRLDEVMAPGGEALAEDFWEYFDSAYLPMHRARSEDVIQASSVTTEGLLTDHSHGNLVGALGGLLASSSDLPAAFSGIVVVNAWRVHETGPDPGERDYAYDQFNHEFAIRFRPGDGKFVIFDQSTGLQTAVVGHPDEIMAALATHLRRVYVDHPPNMNGVPVNFMHFRVELV